MSVREIKIVIDEECDDFDWVFERIGDALARDLPNDWYFIEEVDL